MDTDSTKVRTIAKGRKACKHVGLYLKNKIIKLYSYLTLYANINSRGKNATGQ